MAWKVVEKEVHQECMEVKEENMVEEEEVVTEDLLQCMVWEEKEVMVVQDHHMVWIEEVKEAMEWEDLLKV